MKQFTLYGIENEKFQRLEKLLTGVMQVLSTPYRLQKIHDIDIIVRSGIEAIPSLFLEDVLITGDDIPEESELKLRIEQALKATNGHDKNHSLQQPDAL